MKKNDRQQIRRQVKGRKIQTKGTRDTVDKRNKSIKVNKEIINFIYMQIQEDMSLHFILDKRKTYVLPILEKWWVRPHDTGVYSSSAGVYAGACWSLEHLHKLGIISQEEKDNLIPPIMIADERKDKIIRPWNPKHPVGKKVWKELLEFVENIKKLPEEKVPEIIESAKNQTIKEINKSLANH